jgi:hypothetical protein
MGNSSSTSQKVEQIIEAHTEAKSDSKARNSCNQTVTVDLRGSAIINCGGAEMKQKCSAVSKADTLTVVQALQEAELDSESTQVAEGIAVQMNVSKSDQNMVAKTLTALTAECKSDANNVLSQANHFDYRDILMDCSENPDANLLNITQYGSAEATCVVKQIVELSQKNEAKSKNHQKNIGLKLPDFGACIGVIALVILAPALMPSGNKSSELDNLLKSTGK